VVVAVIAAPGGQVDEDVLKARRAEGQVANGAAKPFIVVMTDVGPPQAHGRVEPELAAAAGAPPPPPPAGIPPMPGIPGGIPGAYPGASHRRRG